MSTSAPITASLVEESPQQLSICPSCQKTVEAERLNMCSECGGFYCGLSFNNCPSTCSCDAPDPVVADVIRQVEPVLNHFCVHDKGNDCDRCFLRGKVTVTMIKDDAGKFVFVSENFSDLWLPCGQSAIGCTNYDLMPRDCADILALQDATVLATNRGVDAIQYMPNPKRPGTQRHWYIQKRCLITKGKKFLVVVAHDITDFVKKSERHGCDSVLSILTGGAMNCLFLPSGIWGMGGHAAHRLLGAAVAVIGHVVGH